mgnify:CR=1 FL=1
MWAVKNKEGEIGCGGDSLFCRQITQSSVFLIFTYFKKLRYSFKEKEGFDMKIDWKRNLLISWIGCFFTGASF